MYKFGHQSLRRLQGVDSRLRALAFKILELHDCTVIYGLRTRAEQKRLFDAKLSKTLNSKHLVGKAIDIAPYPLDWDNQKRFYFFAGMILSAAHELDIKIRWGGDWDMDNDLDDQKFMDLVHFELLE